MSRTFRTSKLAAAGIIPAGREVKESTLRRRAKAFKRIKHHRERRSDTRDITGQMEESL